MACMQRGVFHLGHSDGLYYGPNPPNAYLGCFLSQAIAVRSSLKRFHFHLIKPLSWPIWWADAKYYSHQLKVNQAFHRPSKSGGEERQLTRGISHAYLFVFFSLVSALPSPCSFLTLQLTFIWSVEGKSGSLNMLKWTMVSVGPA